jgi:hypothetical protein
MGELLPHRGARFHKRWPRDPLELLIGILDRLIVALVLLNLLKALSILGC